MQDVCQEVVAVQFDLAITSLNAEIAATGIAICYISRAVRAYIRVNQPNVSGTAPSQQEGQSPTSSPESSCA